MEVLKTEKKKMNPLPEDTQLRLLSKVQDRYLKNIHHPLNLEMTLPNVWSNVLKTGPEVEPV
jgi:hypothetical protein